MTSEYVTLHSAHPDCILSYDRVTVNVHPDKTVTAVDNRGDAVPVVPLAEADAFRREHPHQTFLSMEILSDHEPSGRMHPKWKKKR